MVNFALVLLGPVIVVLAAVIYVAALRTRHHHTSRLSCPKCQHAFEYSWVPLASFSAVRLGTSRYLQCPACHQWSTFDVWSTKTNQSGVARP